MKYAIYGVAGILAASIAAPALAGSAPALHIQPPSRADTTGTRAVVVSQTTLYGQQIAAELEAEKSASTFHQLIKTNGISTSLRENNKGYTAFVPVDSAFQGVTLPAAPEAGTANPQARTLLESHIVNGKFDLNLLHGNRQRVTALSGKDIMITKAGNHYYANGHPIIGRKHNPEGIIYFIPNIIDSAGTRSAIYNPADALK